MKKFKEFVEEMYKRSPANAGRGISQRLASRGAGLAAQNEEDDPDYHKENIERITKSLANNPPAAVVDGMKARLEKHKKRLAELEAQTKK